MRAISKEKEPTGAPFGRRDFPNYGILLVYALMDEEEDVTADTPPKDVVTQVVDADDEVEVAGINDPEAEGAGKGKVPVPQ